MQPRSENASKRDVTENAMRPVTVHKTIAYNADDTRHWKLVIVNLVLRLKTVANYEQNKYSI